MAPVLDRAVIVHGVWDMTKMITGTQLGETNMILLWFADDTRSGTAAEHRAWCG